jgi:hypothetical protein
VIKSLCISAITTAAAALVTIACPLPAQASHINHNAFVAQTTVGISIGRTGGRDLWAVDGQPLVSLFAPPTYVTVSRSANSTITFDANVFHYLSRHIALGGTFEYVGATFSDGCRITQDGGDVTLSAFCNALNVSHAGTGVGFYGVQGRYRVSGGTTLQPIVTLTVGMATTPENPIAMSTKVDGETLILYRNSTWASAHLAEGLSIGVQTSPKQQLQFRAEVRDLRLAEAAVAGPTTAQESVPSIRGTSKQFLSVVIGVDLVLNASRTKRY